MPSSSYDDYEDDFTSSEDEAPHTEEEIDEDLRLERGGPNGQTTGPGLTRQALANRAGMNSYGGYSSLAHATK